MMKNLYKQRAFLKASAIIVIFLIGAKLLNFLKKILIGNFFGVSWRADAFFAASYFPYYMAVFFEGVLFLGFIPLFSQVTAEKGKAQAQQFAGEILFLVLVLTGLFALASWLAAPWFIMRLVPGFRPNQLLLTQELFQILSLVTVFISACSFFKALNSYFGHYVYAASSGIVDALVMISITALSWHVLGISGAAWGSVLGAGIAALLQAIYLFRKEAFVMRWSLQTAWLKTLFFFLIPLATIWVFQLVPLLILNRFGSGMWVGTISALTIAQTMTTVPMGLVSHTVLLAVFPSLAKQGLETNPEDIRQTFFQTLRGAFLILIPTGFLLTVWAKPIAILFFNSGEVLGEGTQRIAYSLISFGWATFSLYADLFMTQSLIAVRRTLPAIILCATRAILTYAACYFFSAWWDYQGLAFGFSIALVLNFLLFPLVFKMSPYTGGWASLYGYSVKLILASVPLLFSGMLVHRFFDRPWVHVPKITLFLGVCAGSIAGLAIYLALLFLFRVKEIQVFFSQIRQSLNREGIFFAKQNE